MSDAAMNRHRVGSGPTSAVLPKLAATALMLVLAAVWLGPVLLIVMTSIKSNAEFLAGPFALPKSPTIQPYIDVWFGLGFGTLMQKQPALCDGRLGAGGGARSGPRFRAQPVRAAGQAMHIRPSADGADAAAADGAHSSLRHLRTLHLLDTKIGLIIVHGVYGMPSQILILRGFMTTIPREIEKAARSRARRTSRFSAR